MVAWEVLLFFMDNDPLIRVFWNLEQATAHAKKWNGGYHSSVIRKRQGERGAQS